MLQSFARISDVPTCLVSLNVLYIKASQEHSDHSKNYAEKSKLVNCQTKWGLMKMYFWLSARRDRGTPII